MASATATKHFRWLVNDSRRWLERRAQQNRQRAEQRLQRFLRETSLEAGRGASGHFETIASVVLTEATDQLVRGREDEEPWLQVDLGLQLHEAGSLLYNGNRQERLACLVSHAAVAGRVQSFGRLAGQLQSAAPAADETAGIQVGWQLHPYSALAASLSVLEAGERVGPRPWHQFLGPYERFISEDLFHSDTSTFTAALEQLADRHLEAAMDLGNNSLDFAWGYQLLPVDVYWACRLRERATDERPDVPDHPLFTGTLGAPPPPPWPRWAGQGLLRDALEHARRVAAKT